MKKYGGYDFTNILDSDLPKSKYKLRVGFLEYID